MEGKKYNISATVGLGAILIGAFLYSIAEDLVVIKNGVKYPNEGGYLRCKIIGTILMAGGLGALSYGIYSQLKQK